MRKDKNTIKKIISSKNIEDLYILDDENAIVVIPGEKPAEYIMIHKRLIGSVLVDVYKWTVRNYYFGSIHDMAILDDLNLFQVQNGSGDFNALYNYKEGRFIVPQHTWYLVDSGRNNSILEKYDGFLASFSISSDYEKDDIYAYNSTITGERIIKSLSVKDGTYYAIIDFDGSIRGNKLFKGDSIARITKIIDLNEYESLDEFKKQRRQLCNEQKKQNKQEFYQLLKSKLQSQNHKIVSPYLDDEVAKILYLKKQDDHS